MSDIPVLCISIVHAQNVIIYQSTDQN